jgi:hypothetical protein
MRAFTLVVCTGCHTADGVFDELRGIVRRSPHGMLVAAGCLVGPSACAARHDRPGTLIVLQPCAVDRTPVGTATWLGPISNRTDAQALCKWVEDGDWPSATAG